MNTSRCPVEGHCHSWSKEEDKNVADRLDRSHSHMHVFWSRRAEQELFGEGKSLDCVLRCRQELLSPALINRVLAVMASVDESQVAADVDIFPKYLKSRRRWRHCHGDKQETWWPMNPEPIYFELLYEYVMEQNLSTKLYQRNVVLPKSSSSSPFQTRKKQCILGLEIENKESSRKDNSTSSFCIMETEDEQEDEDEDSEEDREENRDELYELYDLDGKGIENKNLISRHRRTR
uniref:Uncharacterized protein n=1 Tax=Trichogramma kaykai TaxID=54128 RepID=A0ABD2XLK6_9HYME